MCPPDKSHSMRIRTFKMPFNKMLRKRPGNKRITVSIPVILGILGSIYATIIVFNIIAFCRQETIPDYKSKLIQERFRVDPSSRPQLDKMSSFLLDEQKKGQGLLASLSGSIRGSPEDRAETAVAHTKRADRKNPEQFFFYFSKEGWSNQQQCLKNAYYLARGADRILVLPPVLPHKNGGDALYQQVIARVPRAGDKEDEDYKGNMDPPPRTGLPDAQALVDFYLDVTPPGSKKYIPMENVVDIAYTLPNVTTMDFQEFYQRYYAGNDGGKATEQRRRQESSEANRLTEWILESQYSHFNTLWHYGRSDLEDRTVEEKYPNKFWAGHWIVDETWLRPDIGKLADEGTSKVVDPGQHSQYDVWTFFDAFEVLIDESLLWPDRETYFRFRYSDPIRSTANAVHQQKWQGMPYASIHIRAGGADRGLAEAGCFIEHEHGVLEAIYSTTNEILLQMIEWFEEKQEAGEELPLDIGLFVATDSLRELMISKEWPELQEKQNEISFAIKERYGATVHFFDGRSLADEAKTLEGLVGYPGIFLDQQMASCAEIGFAGTDGACFSTFSRLIRNIRASPSAC